MKVFFAFVLDSKSGKFLMDRDKQLRSSPSLVYRTLGYSLHTGVEYCLFVQGFYQNLESDKRKVLHTFLLQYPTLGALWMRLVMEKTTETRNEYQTPESMVHVISFAEDVLQFTSPGNGGSENPGGGLGF